MRSLLSTSCVVALGSAAQCPVASESLCYTSVSAYKKVTTASSDGCCTACAAEAECQSWTYSTQGSTDNCHLKPAPPTDKTHGDCVSATMPHAPTPPPPPAPAGALNVLFIMVDDLRPEFNEAYGQARMVTPNLDAFSKTALTFDRAYVQYSHCSPSRNSFLSGRSPQTTGVYNFIDHFRLPDVGADWTSLPQFFRQLGYFTVGGGKLFHPNKPPKDDVDLSFDEYFKANGDDGGCRKNETIYNNVCPSDEPDSAFYDSVLADETVEQMRKAKELGRPFFLGTGLRRPHRVWHVPKRFYDLYANNGTFPTDMPLAKFKTAPKDMPDLAYIDNAWPSINMDKNTPIPDHIAALGRWGYYAAVSFTDYNVGKILKALDELELTENTVVLFSGDHGWQLGEHGEWCKRTNFELGVRVPLMIRSPKHEASAGQHTSHMAESLDFYRTLAGLAMPGVQVEDGVEGTDLAPVFAQPSTPGLLKDAAFSQMARCPKAGTKGPESACNTVKLVDIEYMGYTVRTEDWRYTAWLPFNGTLNRALWSGALAGEELYDHRGDTCADFDAFENENVVEAHSNVRDGLLERLKVRFDTPPAGEAFLVV